MKNNYLINVIFIIIMSFLAGCASKQTQRNVVLRQGLCYGELCSNKVQHDLDLQLQRAKIQVNYFGDHIYMVMPSSILFADHSMHLLEDSTRVLNNLAAFIQCYQKISVRVVAYNNELMDKAAGDSLAQMQAYQVANYLWRKGIDSRLIYAIGRTEMQGTKMGNRVEIFLKKLP